MWATCYRATYHRGLNANNFYESMRNVSKGFLERRGDKRMDSSVRVWVEEIIPKYILGYAKDHRDSLVWFNRTREVPLPEFARGMTRWAAQEMMRRKDEGEREAMKIFPIRDSDRYIIQKSNRTLDEALDAKIREGQIPAFATMASREEARAQYIQWLGLRGEASDAFYIASLSTGCDCPYFQERRMPCKHLWALVRQVPGLSINGCIQSLVPSHMIMLDPEVTVAKKQVPLAILPPRAPSAPLLEAGPSSAAPPRPDTRALVNQQMSSFKRYCDCLIKAGYEMEDEVRREMLQKASELVDRFGGASVSQDLFISNQRPPSGSQASLRTSKVIRSARTYAVKRSRPTHAQPSGSVIAGDFNQKSKRPRQGEFISGEEIGEAQRLVNFAGEKGS